VALTSNAYGKAIMILSRRNLIERGTAAATWTAILHSAQALAQQVRSPAPVDAAETDSIAFWNQFFNLPRLAESTNRGQPEQLQSLVAPVGSRVEYVHAGQNGLRYVQDIKPEELSAISGDVMLSVSPGQFRFGNRPGGQVKLENYLHSAQLRLDIHQSQPFLNVLPFLAWTSLAAVFPDKSGRLPSIQQLDFRSSAGESAVDKILLPGGMGTVAVNVSAAKRASLLYKVLQDVAKGAKVLNPVLGLPAISLSALQAFTVLYAQIEEHTTFLLSSVPIHVAVTREAWDSVDRPAQAIPFPPGDYLLYPKGQADLIRPEFERLTIESGYLLNRDADKSLPITDRAEQAAKGLTYVTMHLRIAEVTFAPTGNKNTDQPTGTAEAEKPGKTKKPADTKEPNKTKKPKD
jgi:hypothetical protein